MSGVEEVRLRVQMMEHRRNLLTVHFICWVLAFPTSCHIQERVWLIWTYFQTISQSLDQTGWFLSEYFLVEPWTINLSAFSSFWSHHFSPQSLPWVWRLCFRICGFYTHSLEFGWVEFIISSSRVLQPFAVNLSWFSCRGWLLLGVYSKSIPTSWLSPFLCFFHYFQQAQWCYFFPWATLAIFIYDWWSHLLNCRKEVFCQS